MPKVCVIKKYAGSGFNSYSGPEVSLTGNSLTFTPTPPHGTSATYRVDCTNFKISPEISVTFLDSTILTGLASKYTKASGRVGKTASYGDLASAGTSTTGNTADGCAKKCDDLKVTSGCTAFNFKRSDGECNLLVDADDHTFASDTSWDFYHSPPSDTGSTSKYTKATN